MSEVSCDRKVTISVNLKKPARDIVTVEEKRALRHRQESVKKVDMIRAISARDIAQRLQNGAREEMGEEMFNPVTMQVEHVDLQSRYHKRAGKKRKPSKSKSKLN